MGVGGGLHVVDIRMNRETMASFRRHWEIVPIIKRITGGAGRTSECMVTCAILLLGAAQLGVGGGEGGADKAHTGADLLAPAKSDLVLHDALEPGEERREDFDL